MINPLLYLLGSLILGTVFREFPFYSFLLIPIGAESFLRKRYLILPSIILMFAAGYIASAPVQTSLPEGIYRTELKVIRTLRYDYVAVSGGRLFLLKTQHQLLEGDLIEGTFKVGRIQKGSGYSEYLRRHKIEYYAKPAAIDAVRAGGGLERIRAVIINRVNSVYRNEAGAFQNSILLGYRRDIDPGLKEGFIHSGIVHMLAISGQHTAIFMVLINILLFPVPIGKKFKVALSTVAILFYALLTYMNPPVVRAAVFLALVNAGRLAGKSTHSESAVLLTACGMLIINSNNIYDAGFMLSFLAVYSIISARERFKTRKKTIAMIITAFMIMFATAPVMFSCFGYMSFGSPLMTLLVLPFFNIIMPLGALSVIPGLSFLTYAVNPAYSSMKFIVGLSENVPFLIKGVIDAPLAVILAVSVILFLNRKGAASMLCSLAALTYSIVRIFY